MSITSILFDVGGVIVAPLQPEAVWGQRDELAQRLGYSSGREMWLDFYESDVWQAAKTGDIVHVEMWDALLGPHGITSREEQARFVAALHAGEGLDPAMETLIAALHGRYRLGILSNWDDQLEAILEEELGINHYFDVILNSHHIGVAKPDEAAFRLALERLGARPDQLLFIDDLERNTNAAAALGIHTHTFTDLPTLVANLQRRGLLDGDWRLESSD